NRRLRYGRLVVSGIPHPVRGRDARRGNRGGESLPEGRVRADPHSRARALSDRSIPSRTRRWTKSVPTVNSRLRESWTEDTFGHGRVTTQRAPWMAQSASVTASSDRQSSPDNSCFRGTRETPCHIAG